MFNHLRNTIRILSYRENKPLPHLTPEIQFVDKMRVEHPTIIGRTITAMLAIVIAGAAVGLIAEPILRSFNATHVSATTLAGGIGALIFFVLERVSGAFRNAIVQRFGDILVPHLGHKMEETIKILKG